jgi:hypothetical protein
MAFGAISSRCIARQVCLVVALEGPGIDVTELPVNRTHIHSFSGSVAVVTLTGLDSGNPHQVGNQKYG